MKSFALLTSGGDAPGINTAIRAVVLTGGTMRNRGKILVSDFDGTMTERYFFRVALAHLPSGASAPWERYEQGLTSHFEALVDIFSGLRINEQVLDVLLEP